MSNTGNSVVGKTIYSLLFMVILPALLVVWARATDSVVGLPAVHSEVWGAVLVLLGVILLASGMYALWYFGKGLPMNAYPPPKFVGEGAYRLLPHPIYTGFGMICVGVSIALGSAAGLWLVSPAAILGCIALVWGYERLDLQERFPDASVQYLLSVPPDKALPLAWHHRLSVFVCLLLPWVALNAAAAWAFSGRAMPDPLFQVPDFGMPEWLRWLIGFAAVALVGITPLLARNQHQLRQFFLSGLAGGALILYLSFVFPTIGLGHWTLLPGSIWQKAIFSISWFWIWPAAALMGREFPALRQVSRWVAVLMTMGVILNSVDPVAHTIIGAAGYLVAFFYPAIWEFLREKAEAIANSWKEWVFGPVRVINHGFYAGAAAFTGAMIGSWLAGTQYVIAIVVFGLFGIICAGLWGQFVEGSDKLKRPFGYYGSIIGAAIGSAFMYWMGINIWVMLALFSVMMPWIQAIGRLRCLVNGCCHGALSADWIGISYVHPRSRVCYLAHLKGKPLHPTPLYSILWMAIVGGLLFRLWAGGAAPALIFGAYMMLNGLGRFVEEAYRGEPQTVIAGGLRLYQWAAIASVLIGLVATCFPVAMPPLTPGLSWTAFGWALFVWAFTQFVMGVDFPKSNMRFSRLV
jgi:protein-S-isoprenylcysteine O-methyltransferase Ste14